MQDLLGLGFRLEPEQVWLFEQNEAHAMVPWFPPCPQHQAQCSEGCNYPVVLQDDEPMCLPLPVKIRLDVPPDLMVDLEMELERTSDDRWPEFPSVLAQVQSEYHDGLFNWIPYRIWDLWPITSQEFHGLRHAHDRVFHNMRWYDYLLLTEFEYGDGGYSVWDEIEGRDLIDMDILEKYEAEDDEDGRIAYLESVYEDFMEALTNDVGAAAVDWTMPKINEWLDLDSLGLWEPWERLRASSKRGWRMAARSIPAEERNSWRYTQKWINPWP